MSRTARRVLVAALLVGALGAALLAVRALLPLLVEARVRAFFLDAGVRPVSIAALEASFDRVRVRDLRVGGAQALRVEHVDARGWLLALLRGGGGRVTMRGVRVRGSLTEDGLSFGVLDPLLAPADVEEPAAPLVQLDLTLEDARLELLTPHGDVTVPVEGRVAYDLPQVAASRLDFAVEHSAGRHTGSLVVETGDVEDLAGTLSLRGDAPPLQTELRARLHGAGDARELELALDADARDWQMPLPWAPDAPGVDVTELFVRLDVAGPLDRLAGDGRVRLHGDVRTDALRALGVEVDAELDVTPRDGGSDLRVGDCLRARVARLSWEDVLRLDGPLELCVRGGEGGPILRLAAADGGVPSPRLDAVLEPTGVAGSLGAEDAPLAFEARTPRVHLVHAGATGDAAAHAELAVSEGELTLPDVGVRAADLELRVRLEDGALAGDEAFRLGRVEDTGSPPRFAPLRWSGRLDARGERVTAEGRLLDAEGRLAVDVRATHHLGTGRGHANAELPETAFGSGGLRVEQLSPRLAEQVRELDGRASFRGALRWGGGGLESEAVVVARDVDVASDIADLTRLNAALHFDSLLPPSTPPGQLVSMAAVSAGLVLTEGLVEFALMPDGRLDLTEAQWRLAGGRVFTDGVVDLGAPEPALTLGVEDLSLAQLLASLEIEGLSGEGTLEGDIPVALRDGSVFVEDAELHAREPGGVVRYVPGERLLPPPDAEAPGGLEAALRWLPGVGAPRPEESLGGVDLARAALEDFHYHTLLMTLEGDAAEELVVTLHLAGANPALYDGYPIELNVSVTGAFVPLVSQGLAGYRVPDRIQERLQALGRPER